MADKVDVEVTGKSKYEVAHEMAMQILLTVESRKWGSFNRADYLKAHYDALMVLEGNSPH